MTTTSSIDFDPNAFGITIRKKCVEDHWFFCGTVAELPDVEVFEDSPDVAYEEVLNVIRSLKLAADEQRRTFPEPQIPSDEYSGRVTLRIPKSLHKRSTMIADWEGVSLNQLFVTLIAEGIGHKTAAHMVYPTRTEPTTQGKATVMVGVTAASGATRAATIPLKTNDYNVIKFGPGSGTMIEEVSAM